MNLRFLLPRQSVFFDYFHRQSDCLKKMALLFQEFSQNFSDFESYAKRAKEIEHTADATFHQLVDTLNRTFITPFDREDVYSIARRLDDVIDLQEDVIHNILIYNIPKKRKLVEVFSALILEASQKIVQLMDLLKDLKHSEKVKELIKRVHEIEDEGDVAFEQEMMKLFEEEKDPVAVIKWKDIIENLEIITDKCQGISNVIEGIIIKSS